MISQYIIIGFMSASLLAGWRYGEMQYTAGANAVTAAFAAANADAAEKGKNDIIEIIKWKERTKIVYRDRIKEIKVADDKAGCLDLTISDAGLGGMLRTDSDKTGGGIDSAIGDLPTD